MNAHDDLLPHEVPDKKALEMQLANELARLTAVTFRLREKIKAGTESQFVEPVQAVGQLWGKMHQAVQMPLENAMIAVRIMEEKIRVWLDQRLQSAEGVVQLCQAKINKHNRRLQDRAEKTQGSGAARSAASGISESSTKSNGPHSLQDAAPIISAPRTGGGLPPEPFPAPPTKEELAGLIVPFPDASGAIDLAQLPDEFWQWDNPQRWWLSLEPTPVSRVQISTLRFDGQNVTPGGTIFVNLGQEMAIPALTALLQTFGLPEGSFMVIGQEEAWKANSEAFGPIVTGAAWDYFGIPHPAVSPQMQRLDRIDTKLIEECRNELQTALESPQKPPETSPVQFGPAQPFLPQIGGGAAELGRIGGAAGAALGNLRMPTKAEVCDLLDPLYQSLGVPIEARIPCKNLEEVFAYFRRRLGEAWGEL